MVSGCKATAGCIAYVGISYQTQALQAGLGYAALQNAKGQYVLPTATSIAAEAAYFVKKTPANGTISLIYGPANDGYPIINYEYAIVSNDQSSRVDGQEHPLRAGVGRQPEAGLGDRRTSRRSPSSRSRQGRGAVGQADPGHQIDDHRRRCGGERPRHAAPAARASPRASPRR